MTAMLIKDNHIALAGGCGRRSNARGAMPTSRQIELEVDTLTSSPRPRNRGRRRAARQHGAGDPAPGGGDGRRRAITEASGRITSRNRAGRRRLGGGPDFLRLITHKRPDPRSGARYRIEGKAGGQNRRAKGPDRAADLGEELRVVDLRTQGSGIDEDDLAGDRFESRAECCIDFERGQVSKIGRLGLLTLIPRVANSQNVRAAAPRMSA